MFYIFIYIFKLATAVRNLHANLFGGSNMFQNAEAALDDKIKKKFEKEPNLTPTWSEVIL